MQQKKINYVRSTLGSNFWQTIASSEEFGRNRRNLYALSGAFILFVLGGGTIDHADLFGGSVRFGNPTALYAAAFVLLLYAWWRFEMTRPVHFTDVWRTEYELVWPRTESFAAIVNMGDDRLIDERCLVEVQGKFPKVRFVATSAFLRSTGKATNQGGPYEFEVPWWRYIYARACAALIVVSIGRSVSEILLPRLLFGVAFVLGVVYGAMALWPSPVELVEFTD